ncbi:MAG: S8 family serine peptidase, partial [Candidatus Woesearchaeota archaeon]
MDNHYKSLLAKISFLRQRLNSQQEQDEGLFAEKIKNLEESIAQLEQKVEEIGLLHQVADEHTNALLTLTERYNKAMHRIQTLEKQIQLWEKRKKQEQEAVFLNLPYQDQYLIKLSPTKEKNRYDIGLRVQQLLGTPVHVFKYATYLATILPKETLLGVKKTQYKNAEEKTLRTLLKDIPEILAFKKPKLYFLDEPHHWQEKNEPSILHTYPSKAHDKHKDAKYKHHKNEYWYKHPTNTLWNLINIQADKAQTLATGKNIKIGIIDTGVDYYHPELTHLFDFNNLGYDFINDTNDPFDDHAHGTHV